MTRFYLDNNIWNYLLDEELGWISDRVQRGDIEIVGAFPVLEEILAASHRHPQKAGRMRALALKLVKNRWLREIDERISFEIDREGPMSDFEVFLPRATRRKIIRLSRGSAFANEISESMHAMSARFKSDEEEIRKQVAERFGARPGAAEIRETIHKWFREEDLTPWCLSVLSPKHEETLAQSNMVITDATVPSLWLFVKFKLARIVMCVLGKTIESMALTSRMLATMRLERILMSLSRMTTI